MLKEVSVGLHEELLKDTDPIKDIENSQDIEIYRKRYLPFNESRYELEFGYFRKLLDLCKSLNSATIVVNMPLHPVNLEILPESQKARYQRQMKAICENYGVKFLDLGTKVEQGKVGSIDGNCTFTAKDFTDSVHLRPKSATRFFDYIVEKLKSDRS